VDDWLNGGASWYRGFGIAHFAYPAVRARGMLFSEGDADVPTSTMSDKNKAEAKTQWLPGFPRDPEPCVSIACGTDFCPFTGMLLGEDKEMPLGVVVHALLGKNACNRPVAWLYDGEAVVQGPLTDDADFEIFRLGGYFGGRMRALTVPPNLPLASLPPTRPYHKESSEQGVRDWYDNDCVPWLNGVATAGDTLIIQQGIPTAFASPNGSTATTEQDNVI
jgi:hypothetical protein